MTFVISMVVDIDECANVNCTGHGNCTDLVDGYTCHCDAGYTGVNCETGRCILIVSVSSIYISV